MLSQKKCYFWSIIYSDKQVTAQIAPKCIYASLKVYMQKRIFCWMFLNVQISYWCILEHTHIQSCFNSCEDDRLLLHLSRHFPIDVALLVSMFLFFLSDWHSQSRFHPRAVRGIIFCSEREKRGWWGMCDGSLFVFFFFISVEALY